MKIAPMIAKWYTCARIREEEILSTAEGKKRIQVTFSEALIERLDAYCERTGMSRSAYITYAVASTLDSYEALQHTTVKALAEQAAALFAVSDAEPNEAGNYVL